VILGPLYKLELTRLARRTVQLRLRTLIAVLLLLGLLSAYLSTFPNTSVSSLLFAPATADSTQLSQFGETFLVVFFCIQQVLVVLLTPVYAGGAIADEKERRSLDFILTTPLSNWDIVAGKLAARLTFILGLIATGIPILSLTLFFGGVSPGHVLAVFVISIITAISLGSMAMVHSIRQPALLSVLTWCYGLTLVFFLFGFCFPELHHVTPLGIILPIVGNWRDATFNTDKTWFYVSIYAGIHGMFTLLWLYLSVLSVRIHEREPVMTASEAIEDRKHLEAADRKAKERTKTDADTGWYELPIPSVPATSSAPDWYQLPERDIDIDELKDDVEYAQGRSFGVRPLMDDVHPLAWKEQYFGGRLPMTESSFVHVGAKLLLYTVITLLTVSMIVLMTTFLTSPRDLRTIIHYGLQLYLLLFLLPLMADGLRATSLISEERQRLTLTSLLLLPMSRRELLWYKLSAILKRSRRVWYGILGVVLFAMFLSVIMSSGAILTIAYMAIFHAFCGVLGLCLSVYCRSTLRAMLYYMMVLFCLSVLPLIFGPLFARTYIYNTLEYLSPVRSAWAIPQVNIPYSDMIDPPNNSPYILVAMYILVTATGLLWVLAEFRFRREGTYSKP
jgi:ABC-type transport system involved in multi-copper enzyme maturation permease subunit